MEQVKGQLRPPAPQQLGPTMGSSWAGRLGNLALGRNRLIGKGVLCFLGCPLSSLLPAPAQAHSTLQYTPVKSCLQSHAGLLTQP